MSDMMITMKLNYNKQPGQGETASMRFAPPLSLREFVAVKEVEIPDGRLYQVSPELDADIEVGQVEEITFSTHAFTSNGLRKWALLETAEQYAAVLTTAERTVAVHATIPGWNT